MHGRFDCSSAGSSDDFLTARSSVIQSCIRFAQMKTVKSQTAIHCRWGCRFSAAWVILLNRSVSPESTPAAVFISGLFGPIAPYIPQLRETMPSSDILDRLMSQIHERAHSLPAGSYTTKLITGGVTAMGEKVLEEAAEVVEAAGTLERALASSGTATSPESLAARQQMIYEAGDVVYHLWVMLGSFGVSLDELRQELERREGTSGLEEKRRRKELE